MRPLDLNGLTTYDLRSRPSKVFVEDLGRPAAPDTAAAVGDWLDGLPRQLAANDLRKVRDHLCRARDENRTVVAALGGHVIKTGCGPYLIDWIHQGLLKAVALNGAAAIHDFELALAGKTSEDVGAQLKAGQFGMARETADAFAVAAHAGAAKETGLGAALGDYIADNHCPYADISLVHAARKAGIPCTVHVALGTDIVHMHPHVSGAALGESSLIDFRRLCAVVDDAGARRLAEPRQRGDAAGGLPQGGERGPQLRPQPGRPGRGERGQGVALPQHGQRAEPAGVGGAGTDGAPRSLAAAAARGGRGPAPPSLPRCRPRGRRDNEGAPMSADLIELVQNLGQPRVLVVGDLMLDRYVWGDAERISQEAPVILLHADRREERLGGASSVATMLRALGAKRVRWPASSGRTPTAAASAGCCSTRASTTRPSSPIRSGPARSRSATSAGRSTATRSR